MTSGLEPEHLDNRHRDTLRQIFQHPTSHNIEWHAVLSLLEAVGTVTVRHDGKVAVKLGPEQFFMMGDNRALSLDSRAFGPITRNQFVGRAEQRYWPTNRIGPIK